MTKFSARVYNTFKVNPDTNSTIIKTSKESRLGDEIKYYLALPDKLSIFFPRIISHKSFPKDYSLEMEYYAYSNLGIPMINRGEFNKEFWEKSFNFIFNFLRNCSTYNSMSNFTDSEYMFIRKTEQEYENLMNNFEFFKNIRKYEGIYLNSSPLLSFDIIWPKIKSYLLELIKTQHKHYQIIHGDLCFSNILYGINPINNDVIMKFIDPRGKFGTTTAYGDVYYDLAKLSHSVNGGYEYFIEDNFSLKEDNYNFILEYSNYKKSNINVLFLDFINNLNYNLDKIKVLEGTIFIGMCARHYDNETRQKAMYLTGLRILNEIYNKL